MTNVKLDPAKEVVTIQQAIIDYSITDAALSKLKADYMPLVVADVKDKEGFDKVVIARKDVKSKISAVESKRKELKHDSLEYGRKVDSEAKRITAELTPIKEHLQEQEDIIKKEKERIAAEKQRLKEQRHKEQIQEIVDAGALFDGNAFRYGEGAVDDSKVWLITEGEFEILISSIKMWKENDDLKQAEIARKQKEEEDRIAAEKKEEADKQAKIAEDNRIKQVALDKRQAEQDAKDQAQKDAQAKIDAQNAAIEREKEKKEQERLNAIAIEEAKKKAATDAILEAKKKEDARLEAECLEKERLAEEERQKPDKDKLLWFLSELKTIELPDVKTKKSINIKCALKREIELLVEKYQDKIK